MKIDDTEYRNACFNIKNVRDCLIHIMCSSHESRALHFVAEGALDDLCHVATNLGVNIERYDNDIALPEWYRKYEAERREKGN